MRYRPLSLFGVALVLAVPAAAQQTTRSYSEGGVTQVQYIRVKPGHLDEYMTFLAGPYKQQMEAQKKAGVITGWGAYQSDERDENDWNIVLTTDYKNMAALDNLRDRVDPVTRQVSTGRWTSPMRRWRSAARCGTLSAPASCES